MHGLVLQNPARATERNVEFFFARLILPAGGADAANFGAGDGDADAAVLFDLGLELLVKTAFEFADASAAEAGHVDMIAGAVAFIEVRATAKMEEVEFIHQAVALEKVQSAINGDAGDAGMDLAGAAEKSPGVQVAARGFHHRQKNAALASEADAAQGKLFLQPSGFALNVDALAGGNTMRRK